MSINDRNASARHIKSNQAQSQIILFLLFGFGYDIRRQTLVLIFKNDRETQYNSDSFHFYHSSPFRYKTFMHLSMVSLTGGRRLIRRNYVICKIWGNSLHLSQNVLSKTPRMGLRIYEPPYDKTNKMSARPAKTQINLGIRPV